MPQCIVIADDLTGANATGVLLTSLGLDVVTVLNRGQTQSDAFAGCDCAIFPTNSRSAEAAEAYSRVNELTAATRAVKIKLFSKRIDSTLRGNLGSETDAMLDALGAGYTAIVVPCFPSSGRITLGGYMLVNGLPLHKTEVANDPLRPIHTSEVGALFTAQSKYPVASVLLGDLMHGPAHLAEKLREMQGRGKRILLCDAVTQDEIELIADAALASGIPFIAVDPGVFTATVARKLIAPTVQPARGRVLVAVGSVNAVARRQTEYFLSSQDVHNVYMETGEFLEGGERCEAEVARVVREVLADESHEVCSIIGCGIVPERMVPFEPYARRFGCGNDELSARINGAIADVVQRLLHGDPRFRGLYTCGGDITEAVCKRMGSVGLRLLDEVLPLAAYGEMMGGDIEGLKIVTKGGMVGGPEAIVTCVDYLKEKLLM